MFSKEPVPTAKTRQAITLVVALFVLLLGVPSFLYTTSIHRATLPTEAVDLRLAAFHQAVSFEIPVYILPAPPGLVQNTQQAVDSALLARALPEGLWRLQLHEGKLGATDVVVTLRQGAAADFAHGSAYAHRLQADLKEVMVLSREPPASTADLAAYISHVLLDVVFHRELEAMAAVLSQDIASMVFPYSPEFNINFNLFVENGRPVAWDIARALAYIQPTLHSLRHYCKFRVGTQIQYYSKLNTQPVAQHNLSARVIPQSDLSTFINFGDWNLDTHDIAPSINFVVFVSEGVYRNSPLVIEHSVTNSLMVPQWGGVHIYQPAQPVHGLLTVTETELKGILAIFASQLYDLLGVPYIPELAALRIDSFHRCATLKNLKKALDNLSALNKISESLEGIAIPESTKQSMTAALAHYDAALAHIRKGRFEESVSEAAQSIQHSDKAFFAKQMVQQAYFPSEHKLAVFLPLLGPICSIVLFGIIKTYRSRRAGQQSGELKKEI